MKLILTGGGIDEKAKTAFSLFAKEVDGGLVLYIPFAEEEMTAEENLAWFKKQMEPYGISNIEIIKSPRALTQKKIDLASGIFIGGGNAFVLLDKLKKSKKLHLIQNAIMKNKVILGLSAGATIFGKDINSCLYDELKIIANDKNDIGLTDTEGIEIFKGFGFFVHYKLSDKQLTSTQHKVEKILAQNQNVVGIPEESCIYISEKEIVAFGEKPIEIITKEGTSLFNHQQKVNLSINKKFKTSTLAGDLSFSLAKITDLNEIMQLYKNVIKNTFTTWGKDYPSKKLVEEDILNGNLYILKNGDEIIATSYLGKIERDENWAIKLSRPLSVARICIKSSHQGLGIGKIFLHHLMKKAKQLGADGMHFQICTKNISAMKMYEYCGFKNCGCATSNYGFDFFKYEQKF